MVPRKVMATLLLLYMVAMLAKQSEGYIAFYGREHFRKMEESEKNQAQKKSLSLQQRSDTQDFPEHSEDEGQVIKLTAPVEIGIHLNSRQLEKYEDVLKELLSEILLDVQNALKSKCIYVHWVGHEHGTPPHLDYWSSSYVKTGRRS